METYDEAAVKATFGSKVADDKARLYESLLGALRDYQSKKSWKTRIKELLTDAKILFERKTVRTGAKPIEGSTRYGTGDAGFTRHH
ncbi:MAG: hypothetical protein R2795_16905 [Saprospiraceae bacterium]